MRHRRSRTTERGATLIFVVATITGLLAISGVVVDGGFLYAERRQQQNASDSAAMAGARALDQFQRGLNPSETAVWNAVVTASVSNGSDLDEVVCTLVDEVGEPITSNPSCPRPGALGPQPAARLDEATGVAVETAATRPTSFMSIMGISEMRAPADATATLQAVIRLPRGSAPFMVCGSSPADLKAAMEEEFPERGTYTPKSGDTPATPLIVRSGSSWVVNSAAVYDPVTGAGPAFRIHGPQIARCGGHGASFKGLVDAGADVTVPWIPGGTGVKAGPTRTVTAPYTTVVGGARKHSCAVGQADDCVMVLPICSHSNGGNGSGFEMRCVMFGSFYVRQSGANKHDAYLLGQAAVVVDGVGGGKPNDHEARLIKLYE